MATAAEVDATAALAEVFGVLSHSVRIRILRHFGDGAELSASRLEDVMPVVPLGTLAYHVRQLASAGLLRSAGHVQRREAVENLYLLTPKGARVAAVLAELPGRL